MDHKQLTVDPKALAKFVNSIAVAVTEATRLGYEVNPDFVGFGPGHP